MFAVSAFTRRNFAHETGFCLAGVSRAGLQCYCRAGWRAGRCGPEVARLCFMASLHWYLHQSIRSSNINLFLYMKHHSRCYITVDIYTTIAHSPVRKNLSLKFDEFLAGCLQFDSDHRIDFCVHTCCQSVTFGPLFAFYCPLFFTKKNN